MGLGEFLFKIRGDATQFGASVAGAAGRLNQFGGLVTGVFTRYVLPYMGARAMAGYARGTMQWADSLTDLNNITGIGIESLQEWGYALKLTRGSLEDLKTAVRTMAAAQGNALTGSKEYVNAFEGLGISLQELKSMGAEDMLKRISDWMEGRTLTQRNRDDLQMVLGRSASQLIPAMIEGMEGFRKAARDAGIVIEEEIVQSLARANDEWDKFLARAKAMGVGPLNSILGGMVSQTLGSLKGLSKFLQGSSKVGGGLVLGALGAWLEKKLEGPIETAQKVFTPEDSGKKKPRPFEDWSGLSKRGGGSPGLSGDVDQWGRMGLYATSGQQIYQRSVLLSIRMIQKDIAAIKGNTADTATAIDERM